MSAEWLDAFPRQWDAVQEHQLRETSLPGKPRLVVYYPGASREGGSDGVWLRITPEGGPTWTGVFSSDNLPGRLNLVASWPQEHTVFVAAGGPPYLVDSRDPDRWSRIERSAVRRFEPVGDRALLLDDDVLSAYDADGLAWESDHLGPSVWLGVLDDEVHLRSGDLLHRVALRHGRTVTEPASW
ncbi:MAG TPA: hypothetical protein VMZ11_01400 [Mycobacteriales bacterium]|nr:hypothetical protein [Mycobacteriales bacterium]